MPLSFFSSAFPPTFHFSPFSLPSLGPNQSTVVGKEPIVCGAISCGSTQSRESYLHVDEKKKNRLAEESRERKRITQRGGEAAARRESDCDFLEIAIYQERPERESRSVSGNAKNPVIASADGLFQPDGFCKRRFFFWLLHSRESIIIYSSACGNENIVRDN